MENASRALIIAGSILLGLITISLFYFMFNRISQYADITSKNTSQEELLAYNQGFEAYNKKLMYGTDIISVINKAIDNNSKYDVQNDKNNEYYIDIEVKFKGQIYTAVDIYDKIDDISELKTKTFTCSNVSYNKFGRVSKMSFIEYP